MADPIRVLHVNSGNLYGGVETFLGTLAECRKLAPGMVPEFALCFPGRLERELRGSGCAVHDLGPVRFSRPWTTWRARQRLRRLIARGRHDAVICHQPWVQLLAGRIVARGKAAYAAYFHGVVGDDWIERRSRAVRPDVIIAPSDLILQTASEWHSGVPRSMIRNPLPARFQNTPMLSTAERENLRRSLGAEPGDAVVLMATRVERLKGPDVAIRALALLKETPGWRFWYAGQPQRPHEFELYGELQRLAAEGGIAGRVAFLGERTDMPALMQAADVYTQPNRNPEGYGLTFIEAASRGAAVATTTLGAAAGAVDETTALIVPPNDVPAFAEALRRLIADAGLRAELGERGRIKALDECDPGSRLRDLEDALRQAIARKRSGAAGG